MPVSVSLTGLDTGQDRHRWRSPKNQIIEDKKIRTSGLTSNYYSGFLKLEAIDSPPLEKLANFEIAKLFLRPVE